MEPVSAIVLSLALGAKAAAGTAIVGEVVKDAYAKVKEIIAARFSSVPLSILESAPESESRRAVVAEDLTKLQAAKDTELVEAARKLIQLIQERAPQTAEAIGVNIKDVEAAGISLADIASSGPGVVIERAKVAGDINVRGVRAGLDDVPPKNG